MEKWCLEHPVVYTSTALVIWQGFYTVAPNKRNPPKHTILTCCSTCISCPWQPLTGTFPLILTHFVLLRSCTLHYRNVAVLDQPLLNPLSTKIMFHKKIALHLVEKMTGCWFLKTEREMFLLQSDSNFCPCTEVRWIFLRKTDLFCLYLTI